MGEPFCLLGISGSLRTSSYSESVLNALAEAAMPKAEFSYASIGGLPHYNQDVEDVGYPDAVVIFRDQVKRADGIVIVSSEYNHGIPGVLKNALDWASRPGYKSPFKNKPVLIVTQSPAFTGGVRAQHQLRETLHSMLAKPALTSDIVIGQIHKKIDDGRFKDDDAINFALIGFEKLYAEIQLGRHRAELV